MNFLYNARTMDVQTSRTIKFTVAISIGLFVSLMIEPSPFRWGLAIGAVVGAINTFLMYNRMKHIAAMSKGTAVSFMQFGFVMRLLLIMAVLFLALNFEGLNIFGVAFGIFIAPIITMVDFNISLIKDYKAHDTLENKNQTERGENW
ncbi:ATP synthase subunit I [Peptococcaceae bacterium 1198_IL3148]